MIQRPTCSNLACRNGSVGRVCVACFLSIWEPMPCKSRLPCLVLWHAMLETGCMFTVRCARGSCQAGLDGELIDRQKAGVDCATHGSMQLSACLHGCPAFVECLCIHFICCCAAVLLSVVVLHQGIMWLLMANTAATCKCVDCVLNTFPASTRLHSTNVFRIQAVENSIVQAWIHSYNDASDKSRSIARPANNR